MRPIESSVALLIGLTLGIFAGSCNSATGADSPSDATSPRAAAAPAADPMLKLDGMLSYPGGAPVQSTDFSLRIAASGTSLFRASSVPACQGSEPHMEGAFTLNLRTDDSGKFSAQASLGDFTSVTNQACKITGVDWSSIDGLTITASLPADSSSCQSYCAASPLTSCESNCVNGQRLVFGTLELPQSSLAPRTSEAVLSLTGQRLALGQLGPAISRAGGPDLQINASAAASSLELSEESFAPTDCAVVEGCVNGPGVHRLLSFDTEIENLGDQDFVLGSPVDNPLFVYSACHNHYHLGGIMLYELIDPASGAPVSVGGTDLVARKQGFCMMDMLQNADGAPGKFDCDDQGISSGWADDYDASLDCQWLDVTGAPPGQYTLKLVVNPQGLFTETDTSNNTVEIPVTIPPDTGTGGASASVPSTSIQ